MAGLDRRGAVFVLTLGDRDDDENRFHPDRLAAINAALDDVEAAEGPKAGPCSARSRRASMPR